MHWEETSFRYQFFHHKIPNRLAWDLTWASTVTVCDNPLSCGAAVSSSFKMLLHYSDSFFFRIFHTIFNHSYVNTVGLCYTAVNTARSKYVYAYNTDLQLFG